jgi:PBP1b-binding outer membrane lipoprotein LpoB
MRWVLLGLVGVVLIATILVSGCVQQQSQAPSGGGATGNAVQKNFEIQAENTLDQELESSTQGITGSEVESLLTQ